MQETQTQQTAQTPQLQEPAVKRGRGRPKIHKEPVIKVPKKRGRPRLSEEQKAQNKLNRQNAPKPKIIKKTNYLAFDMPASKRALLVRAAKIRGQVNGLERVIYEEKGCEAIFNQATAIKGGVEALMKLILEEDLRQNFANADTKAQKEEQIAHFISTLKSYFRQR